jgi:hypothetical protein
MPKTMIVQVYMQLIKTRHKAATRMLIEGIHLYPRRDENRTKPIPISRGKYSSIALLDQNLSLNSRCRQERLVLLKSPKSFSLSQNSHPDKWDRGIFSAIFLSPVKPFSQTPIRSSIINSRR